MGYKKMKIFFFSLFIFFYIQNFRTEILYEKNNLVITDFDIEYFSENYQKIYNLKLSTNQIIKNIVLLKNLFIKLNKNNPNLVKFIDEKFIIENNQNLSENNIIKDFNRFIFIKNDFINTYYKEFLLEEDIKLILKKIKLENISLSTNSCLIIDKNINVKEVKNFEKKIYDKIRGIRDTIDLLIDNKTYEICLGNDFYYQLDIMLFSLLEIKTNPDFTNYLYENQK